MKEDEKGIGLDPEPGQGPCAFPYGRGIVFVSGGEEPGKSD